MKAFALEDVEMLDSMKDCLSILFRGAFFALNLNQEAMQMFKGHGAVV